MSYNIGDKIRIVFKTNLFIEGLVSKLSPLELKLADDSSIIDIDLKDIFYIKVYSNKKDKDYIHEMAKIEAEKRISESEEDKSYYKDSIFETYDAMNVDQEGNYGLPNFSALKIPKQYTDKKTRNKKPRDKE